MKYKNVEYQLWKNPMTGTYCAYVKLQKNHPFIVTLRKTHIEELYQGRKIKVNNFRDLPIKVHGKLSFGRYYKDNSNPRFTKGWWIGWDYGHKGDFAPKLKLKRGRKEKFWSEKEVIAECKNVIEQVIKYYNVC